MNEYRPLAELFPLKPGTVLQVNSGSDAEWVWDGANFCDTYGDGPPGFNPFKYPWRIVSEPPVRLEFEAVICRTNAACPQRIDIPIDSYSPIRDGDRVRVTVEKA